MRRWLSRWLPWIVGAGGAAACAVGAALTLALGAPPSFLLAYLVGILLGILGALVAAREPRNSIGWLMCAISVATSLLHLPSGYAYYALVSHHGSWPLASVAAWFGTWSWVPVIAFLPLISVRFPDGRTQRYMHAVDWIVVSGVVLFAGGIALAPASTVLGFSSIPGVKVAEMERHFHDLAAGLVPGEVAAQFRSLGLVFLVTGYVASATALVTRFRAARGEQRLQIEWFAYAGALVAVAFVYGGVAWTFLGQPLYLALTPLEVAVVGLPIAIGIAILRYRLYDIDILINRTLVYGSATAILGGVYSAVVTLLNRLFISVSGQKSDAAYVVTAFVVVIAFGPIKDWLQRTVDRRFPHSAPGQVLDEFRSGVEAVVTVLDVDRIAREFLERTTTAFDAHGAALYLERSSSEPYVRGDVSGPSAIEVPLRHEGRGVGRLALGTRRGGLEYTKADRAALDRSAAAVAEAIVLASELGRRGAFATR